ncbi:hypothetical protein HNP48_004130 [Acidovorax soli]|uniref:Uncharacterized protein n=1 Tax=Acidovorax soli TaxID=592050 RepID=A0A7X0UAN3_9BURK|nr:hypothetical protein [Acidovorax soli]MBB6561437.1 hypothetical protein [Acidovorax soli]
MNEATTPTQSKGDYAHALAKASLSAIPLIGGPAVELFQATIQPPLEKRRIEWMRAVGERLAELQASQQIDLDRLSKSDEFVTAVMHASQLALKTHQKAKLEALKNAVINIAKGQTPEDAVLHIYLHLIDDLAELQIQILAVFQAPTSPPGMSMGGLNHVLEHCIPSCRGKNDLYRQLWRDLYNRGLINVADLGGTISQSGLSSKRTTDLADQFLRFIEG